MIENIFAKSEKAHFEPFHFSFGIFYFKSNTKSFVFHLGADFLHGASGRVTNVNGVRPVRMPILCKSAHERHMN